MLRALILHAHDDASRLVRDAHCRVGRIDRLAALHSTAQRQLLAAEGAPLPHSRARRERQQALRRGSGAQRCARQGAREAIQLARTLPLLRYVSILRSFGLTSTCRSATFSRAAAAGGGACLRQQ